MSIFKNFQPFSAAKMAKKDPLVPQNEKVLTRFSQVGAPPYRLRLSVHKQTLPIGTDLNKALPCNKCGLR